MFSDECLLSPRKQPLGNYLTFRTIAGLQDKTKAAREDRAAPNFNAVRAAYIAA